MLRRKACEMAQNTPTNAVSQRKTVDLQFDIAAASNMIMGLGVAGMKQYASAGVRLTTVLKIHINLNSCL